jgi:hypothetical protein
VSGLFFDGNKDGSGEPLLSLTGSLQSATIDLSMVEDDAVELPTSSIGASEMFNEPGAASVNSTTGLANPGDTTLLIRSLTAPAIGRVLAIGTVQMDVVHTEGTNDAFDIGIGLGGTTIPSEQNFDEAAEREGARAVTAERVRLEVAAMRHRLEELEALLADQREERR